MLREVHLLSRLYQSSVKGFPAKRLDSQLFQAVVIIFINDTLFNLALWFKLYFSFRESYDLILI